MGRKSRKLKLKRIIAIFCEGETEKIYFEILKVKYRSVNVDVRVVPIKGQGQGIQLIQYAQRSMQTDHRFKESEVDETYIVFDRDDIPEGQLKTAFTMAKENGYKILFSNECFDLWLLLHFEECPKALTRRQIYRKLAKYFQSDNYEKLKANKEVISRNIRDRVIFAMENPSNAMFTDFEVNPYSNAKKIIQEIYDQDQY